MGSSAAEIGAKHRPFSTIKCERLCRSVSLIFAITSVTDRLQDPMKSPLSSFIILIAFVSLSRTTNDSVVWKKKIEP